MYRQSEKNLLSSSISSTRPHNMVAQIVSLVWSTPANFNGFCVLPSSLLRRRSLEANHTLHDVWPYPALLHYIYIFGDSCPLTEFCPLQNSLYVQVLRYLILAPLLHGTPAAGVSQTLWRWTEGATYIRQGGHPGNAGCKKLPKIRHLGTIAQLCWAIPSQLSCISTVGKNLLNSNISPTCPPLVAEICWRDWGTPANFSWFRLLAALLHGTELVGVSQTLRHWTEGITCIRQGSHHVGHWPTF